MTKIETLSIDQLNEAFFSSESEQLFVFGERNLSRGWPTILARSIKTEKPGTFLYATCIRGVIIDTYTAVVSHNGFRRYVNDQDALDHAPPMLLTVLTEGHEPATIVIDPADVNPVMWYNGGSVIEYNGEEYHSLFHEPVISRRINSTTSYVIPVLGGREKTTSCGDYVCRHRNGQFSLWSGEKFHAIFTTDWSQDNIRFRLDSGSTDVYPDLPTGIEYLK